MREAMFSDIGNILATYKPRQTESTDTRQALQRHDSDFEQQHKKKEDKDQDSLKNEDIANVSVKSLHLFLNNLLKSRNNPAPPIAEKNERRESTEGKSLSASQAEMDFGEAPKTSPGIAAKAAQAYETTAHSAEKAQGQPENPPPYTAQALALSASEIRVIYKLLDELQDLSERHIEYLQIERGETFLQSLVTAVEKAIKQG